MFDTASNLSASGAQVVCDSVYVQTLGDVVYYCCVGTGC
jgi:hypothetical protein